MIRTSKLKPGSCLPSETSLAKSFGTSRATIREALSGLKVLGLYDQSRKGNFIKKPSIHYQLENIIDTVRSRMSFLEALEARRAIEGEICYLAAKRRTDNALREIETALENCKEITSVDQYIKADYEFHLALAKASDNSLFIQFIKEALLKLDQPYYNVIRFAEAEDDSSRLNDFLNVLCRPRSNFIRSTRGCQSGTENMLNHLQAAKQKFIEYNEAAEAGSVRGTAVFFSPGGVIPQSYP